MERSAKFFESLGLRFERHSHPPCGEHIGSVRAGCLLEIYPRKHSDEFHPMTFGFNVSNVELAVVAASAGGAMVKREAHSTDFGRMAIVTDPDGNSVLLMEVLP